MGVGQPDNGVKRAKGQVPIGLYQDNIHQRKAQLHFGGGESCALQRVERGQKIAFVGSAEVEKYLEMIGNAGAKT